VLILGAGSGTDVAAALRHGATHVTAVDIDPVILRLGAERHPDKPYSDPRVTVVCDDARHFLRTTTKKYDLVVFALIDSLTVQSSFSGVRLESYMFTKESFEAVRDHLSPRGVMVLYNYFREKWLVDRLANTAADVFGRDPLGHVHQDRAYLAGHAGRAAGRGAHDAAAAAGRRERVRAGPRPEPPRIRWCGIRASSRRPTTGRSSTCGRPGLPRHYLGRARLVLVLSALAVWLAGPARTLPTLPRPLPSPAHLTYPSLPDPDLPAAAWSWHFFLLGAGFMLLETKSIVQFALLWGSTWSSASLGDRVGARDGARERAGGRPGRDSASRRDRRRPAWADRAQLLRAGRAGDVREPRGRVALLRRARLQPGLLRRLLFSSSFRQVVVDGDRFRRRICSARSSAASASICRSSPGISFC
jgi:hypothetical protein